MKTIEKKIIDAINNNCIMPEPHILKNAFLSIVIGEEEKECPNKAWHEGSIVKADKLSRCPTCNCGVYTLGIINHPITIRDAIEERIVRCTYKAG